MASKYKTQAHELRGVVKDIVLGKGSAMKGTNPELYAAAKTIVRIINRRIRENRMRDDGK